MGVGWDLGDVTRAIEGFAGIEFDTSDVTIAVSELNETMTGIGQTLERIAEALERAQEAPRPLPPIINHVWIHDVCDWCGTEFVGDGVEKRGAGRES